MDFDKTVFDFKNDKRVFFYFSVRSAAEGMAQVYQHGTSGDTWLVNNNKPAINITEKVKKAHHILSEDLFS